MAKDEAQLRKGTIALGALVIMTLGVAGLLSGCAPTSPDTVCTVDDKDRTTNSEGSSVYRIYSDCGVFNVEDAPFLGKFNSADTYAKIEVGKTYEFETYGFRNGFTSDFPNITQATEVQK